MNALSYGNTNLFLRGEKNQKITLYEVFVYYGVSNKVLTKIGLKSTLELAGMDSELQVSL